MHSGAAVERTPLWTGPPVNVGCRPRLQRSSRPKGNTEHGRANFEVALIVWAGLYTELTFSSVPQGYRELNSIVGLPAHDNARIVIHPLVHRIEITPFDINPILNKRDHTLSRFFALRLACWLRVAEGFPGSGQRFRWDSCPILCSSRMVRAADRASSLAVSVPVWLLKMTQSPGRLL